MPLTMDAAVSPPVFDVDPFSDEVLSNLYDYQARLRAAGPVVYIPRYDIYAVGRYAEVQQAMSDWKNFSSASGTGLGNIKKGDSWRIPSAIVEVDPPDHTRVRSALMKVLSPIVVRSWRAGFDKEAGEIADELVSRGRFDGVKDLVEPFVLKVFPDALGLDDEGRQNLLVIGDLTANGFGPNNELTRRATEAVEPLLPWFDSKFERQNMLPTGFGARIWELADAGELDMEWLPGILRTFLRGGTDTVISGVSSTLHKLATHPRQWDLLKQDPSLTRAAFEEAIRLESPAQFIFRTTTREQDLAGYRLAAAMKVMCSLASANRDPLRWEQPEEYDITRRNVGHMALGAGVHVCIGQMIARAEAEAVIGAVTARVARLELDGPAVYRKSNGARRLDSLPLRVTPK
ncbi:cytochrome P450 [Bosea sp. (in: a-proteobacteria)]|uniref:cytochrome P450 n=1 Tax=Bosea sp. (in: a-proteobacteria) TaxID=1871050 RepID=UPI00262C2397|nr:cytochrome P450 [Bosea sp. (in: a-proteobacteria)]MCO5089837.1 cytochrome P450 [Bosea sp. (in: a-proteobacteria)]